ncbi:MAG: tetratricopeptide repeat protein [Mangrovibacterium sp.]
MKKIISLFLLIHAGFLLSAHEREDSLLSLLGWLEDGQRLRVLNELSELCQETDSSRSLDYAREALVLAEASGNIGGLAEAWFYMGECLFCFDQFDRAMLHYRKALELMTGLDDQQRLGDIYNSMSLVHYYKGEYDLALARQIDALHCLEHSTDLHGLAHVYSNMGMVYSRLDNYRQAIKHYRQAARINREGGFTHSMAVNYNGIGVAYYNLDMADSARYNYHMALNGFRQVNDRRREAITLNNIANLLVDQQDSLDTALQYFKEALAVFEALGDNRNRVFVLESLGAAYMTMDRVNLALQTLQDGLNLALEYRLGHYICRNYYRDISRAYEKSGKVSEAFAAYKLYRNHLDSLHQEERIRQVTELEKKFETDKKEAEILRLQREKELGQLQMQKERTIRTLVSVLLFLAIGSIFLIGSAYMCKRRAFSLLNQKNEEIEKQRNELEKINATKNRFFSILAHDLKNPFHAILGYSSLLDKEYERFSAFERRKIAADIHHSSSIIFRLLQNLLDWSRSQTGNLTCKPLKLELLPLSENVFRLLKKPAEQKNIRMENRIPEGTRVHADPMMTETILRNLLSNALKFSYEGGQVLLETRPDGDHQVCICIKDQGEGLTKEDIRQLFRIDSGLKRKGTSGEVGTGLGLVLSREFAEMNRGSICVESTPGEGSTFCVRLPAG